MKQILMSLVLVLMGSSAMAGTQQSVTNLVHQLSAHLAEVNAERAARGEKLYCDQIDARQRQHIVNMLILGYSWDRQSVVYKDFSTFTTGQLAGAIADKLFCYPMTCPDNAQSTLVGVICNAKALKMDKALIMGTLSKIAGREINRNEPASNVLGK